MKRIFGRSLADEVTAKIRQKKDRKRFIKGSWPVSCLYGKWIGSSTSELLVVSAFQPQSSAYSAPQAMRGNAAVASTNTRRAKPVLQVAISRWFRSHNSQGSQNGGGGGSRTRVLRSFHAGFYKFSRKLYVFSGGFGIRPPHSGTPPEVSLTWWRTTSTEPGLDHTLNHVLGQPG